MTKKWTPVLPKSSLLVVLVILTIMSSLGAIAGPTNDHPSTAVATQVTTGQADQLQQEINDLQILIHGELPQHVALPALFEIDLIDEAAVQQRIQTLKDRLAAGDVPDTDSTTPDALRKQRDRLRLAFLQMPQDTRNNLREQDRLQRENQALLEEKAAAAEAQSLSEKARDQALATASQTQNDVTRALATEEARLLAHLSELAALRQAWAASDQAQLLNHQRLLARYNSHLGKVIQTQEADALYQSIREDLRDLRDKAERALDSLSSPSGIVALTDMLPLDNPAYAAHGDSVKQLQALRLRIAKEEAEMRSRETEDRYANLESIMDSLRTLQAQRITLLPQLTPALREEMTGFTEEGFNRLISEIAHVRLMARWYPVQRMHDAKGAASLFHNLFKVGRFSIDMIGFLAGVSFIMLLKRRCRRWLGSLRAWMAGRLQPPSLMLLADRLMQLLIAIAHEILLLLTVYFLFDWLPSAPLAEPELVTLRQLAYAYAWYALSLAFIHRILLTELSRYRVVEPELNERILQSLRIVARLWLFIYGYLIVAQVLLGRGALYGIAESMATIGVVLVSWRLIREWRSEVTHAYLKYSPDGVLADLVRKTETRSVGLLLAIAAFSVVATRSLWVWLQGIALGFEQTRKALAYLFRRQLERQSRSQAQTLESSLPEALVAAFTEDPVIGRLSVEYYPRLAEILEICQGVAAGQPGQLIALVGERGAGKTSWLAELRQRIGRDIACTHHEISDRVLAADDVCKLLCKWLDIPETTDPEQIICQTRLQPPRVVLVDLGQNLLLRKVGGLAGHSCFLRIAMATAQRVVWVISYARWSFDYLQQTQPGRDVYNDIIELAGWPEAQIGQLIESRMAAAGLIANYDLLRLNTVGITVSAPTGVNHETTSIEQAADRYHRLIWDYADGNPRVALHFFRLSLIWETGNQVTVRLFPTPATETLEAFEARTRFLLACLVKHENLTALEASESLCFPLTECERTLQLLHHQGCLLVEAGGRYRVTSHWNRAVLRFLMRKKLLSF